MSMGRDRPTFWNHLRPDRQLNMQPHMLHQTHQDHLKPVHHPPTLQLWPTYDHPRERQVAPAHRHVLRVRTQHRSRFSAHRIPVQEPVHQGYWTQHHLHHLSFCHSSSQRTPVSLRTASFLDLRTPCILNPCIHRRGRPRVLTPPRTTSAHSCPTVDQHC